MMTIGEILAREALSLGRPVERRFTARWGGMVFIVYDVAPTVVIGHRVEQRRWVVFNRSTQQRTSGIVYCHTTKEAE